LKTLLNAIFAANLFKNLQIKTKIKSINKEKVILKLRFVLDGRRFQIENVSIWVWFPNLILMEKVDTEKWKWNLIVEFQQILRILCAFCDLKLRNFCFLEEFRSLNII